MTEEERTIMRDIVIDLRKLLWSKSHFTHHTYSNEELSISNRKERKILIFQIKRLYEMLNQDFDLEEKPK